ncbi:unnamed protein product, partial [Oppiella nova]
MDWEEELDGFKYDSDKYEKKRIKVLQQERETIQTKTFRKWINSILIKANEEVHDIFTDLSDGRKLLKLLELVSGESIGKPNTGRELHHKLDNVGKCLTFVKSKVRLESIGPQDIVDGNKKLILGLIWTIILRFQIQSLNFNEFNIFDVKSAKEALLLWCQLRTAKYPNVRVTDFSCQSWRSGMAFNALIHAHRPDLIRYDRLHPHNHNYNLNLAFDVASRELAVPRLLDAEDFDNECADEKSIVTYLSCFYHMLSKIKSDMKCSKRIANIITQLIDVERLQLKYEYFTKSLINWIQIEINELKDRNLPNNALGIQQELIKFKEYITVEKPPKLRERNECEGIHFEIQTLMKSLGHPLYKAPEGLTVKDIEREWTELEKEENKRQLYLRQEFLRLEKLESLANRFERKCVLREAYINEKLRILSEPIYANQTNNNFEANYKKHKTISADILAQTEKFNELTVMARQLIDGNYYDKEEVMICEKHITNKWRQLLDMLRNHQNVFTAASELLLALREAEIIANEIKDMAKGLNLINKKQIQIPFGVEELIERHNIFESQMASKEETIDKLNSISDSISGSESNYKVMQLIKRESPELSTSLQTLNNEYMNVSKLVKLRKISLNQMRDYYQLINDIDEEETTICERLCICQSVLVSKDLLGVHNLQRKHELLVIDIKTQEKKINYLINYGKRLIDSNHTESDAIKQKIQSLGKKWKSLNESIDEKSQQINDAIEAFQYHKEANEVESWLKEKMNLFDAQDIEVMDETNALALFRRHSQIESEIRAFDNDIKRLNMESNKMIKSGISALFVLSGDSFVTATQIGCNQMQSLQNNGTTDETESERNSNDSNAEIRSPQKKRLSIICNAESVEQRQENINSCYFQLLNMCCVKRKKLKDFIQLLRYNQECNGLENWVLETKRLVTDINMNYERGLIGSEPLFKDNSDQPIATNSESKQIKRTAQSYAQNQEFSIEQQNRQKRMRYDWNQLNLMMNELEDALTTVEDINSTCNQMVTNLSHQFITDATTSETIIENNISHLNDNREIIIEECPEERYHKENDIIITELDENEEIDEELIAFNTEFTKISYLLKSCEMRLESEVSLGETLESVYGLQKRHENFIATLLAQDERLHLFGDMADKLIDAKHYDSPNIESRRKQVIERRVCVKEKALERTQVLNDALNYQELRADAEDFQSWCSDKKKTASDESYKELQNMERKVQKHEAFEAELAANQSRLTAINQRARDLISSSHFASREIEALVKAINDQWLELFGLTESRGQHLRQASNQLDYNKTVERAKQRLEELNKSVTSKQMGTDLRSCKELIQKHNTVEVEVQMWEKQMEELMRKGEEMAETHFDGQKIVESCYSVNESLRQMKTPLEERRLKLLESFKFYEFEFEINAELQWIREHMPSAKSATVGHNLTDAQNMMKKYKQNLEREVDGHEGKIQKTLTKGEQLVQQKHFREESIEHECKQLAQSWHQLKRLVLERKKLLEISLKMQHLLSEATEVESWMNE